MGKAIVVLAGQSNASRISSEIEATLAATYGQNGYVLVEVYSAGAPLTYSREGKQDWSADGELRELLITQTHKALSENSDNYLAGTIWLQGEADTYPDAQPQNYAGEFIDVFSSFRDSLEVSFGADRTLSRSSGVQILNLSENAPAAPSRKNWDAIQSAINTLGATWEWITTLDPDRIATREGTDLTAMFSDSLHYSDAFSMTLAETLVAGLQETAPPSLPGRVGTPDADVFAVLIGADTMIGGAGDDIYHVDHAGDQVLEYKDEGYDQVYSSVSFELRAHSQHIEKLTLTGEADIDGTGNKQANTIIGNQGDNVLNGAWGNDRLIGGAGNDIFRDDSGADTMIGGAGDDIFHVDHAGDQVLEYKDEGYDQVYSTISVELRAHSQHIEKLTLTGEADIDGTGNKQANTIIGNQGDNVLNGAWGNDRLIGGAGSDTFVFVGNFGQDVVVDFDLGEASDRIDLTGVAQISDFDDLLRNHVRDMGDYVIILDSMGNSINLNDIRLEGLSDSLFAF